MGKPSSRSGVQQQARALGDPTRYAIFQQIAAAGVPVRVAALTQQFRLNHNAVRQHLAKLCDAVLVVEEVAPRSGPGRPALQYRLAPGVHGSWATDSPYEQLSLYLLEIARSGRHPREVGVEAGRKAAGADHGEDQPALDRLLAEMQRRGFEPRAIIKRTLIEVVLDACPFANAAAEDPAIVCEIHRGIVEGLVEAAGAELTVIALHLRNPLRAGCRVRLRPT